MKKFLVKIDPALPGSDNNWRILNFEQFEAFLRTEEGFKRKDCFERIDGADEDDDIIYIECDSEKCREIKSARNHSDYLRKAEEESGYVTVSLDEPVGIGSDGDETTLLDLIADEKMDTGEMAVMEMCRKELPAALSELRPLELDLIMALYVREERISQNAYAERVRIDRHEINELHKTALRKLRLHFRRKRLI